MSERWKPGFGDTYYYVDNSCSVDIERYDGHTWDDERIAVGNCFNTKDDAHAAAEKVKALLLSLHQPATECSQLVTNCNQLPKLTTEVFNRPDCPEWAQYAAVDSNGAGYYYSEKPFILSDAFGWGIVCSETNQSEFISGNFNNSDWQNSLIERPAVLPDWCKVGEWVWTTTYNKYFKINRIDNLFVYGESSAGDLYSVKFENVRQARLRPYNADELRGLVGKVVTTSSGRHCTLVTACKQEYSVIEPQVMLNKWLYATDLLNGGNTIDGEPCGVLEHLENGEWVE